MEFASKQTKPAEAGLIGSQAHAWESISLLICLHCPKRGRASESTLPGSCLVTSKIICVNLC